MQVSDRELTPERYNFSFCNTILVSQVKEGKAREAAALLRDILARDLDRTAEANVESLKTRTSHQKVFDRNDMVLRATIEANLVEEAKEIALLLIKRDMKFQTFFMSQICQASHSFTLYKLARIAGCAISPSGRELAHLLSQKNFGDRSLACHRP